MRAHTRDSSIVQLVAMLLAVAVVAASCSPGRDHEAADNSPTFRRVTDKALQPTKPISQVADLQMPVAAGDPWRVVGSIVDPDSGVTKAAVWTSDNPTTGGGGWKRKELEPADKDVSESIEAVVPFKDSLLAVGKVGDGERSDGAVWRQHGDDWERLTPPEMAGTHGQLALHVAVNETGVLVAGGETSWGDVRPRLWFSTDGTNWRSVDGGAGGPLDGTGEESVSGISAFGTGFVAVGRRDVDGNQDAIVWMSADGTTWEQVDAPALGGDGRQSAESIAFVNGVLVAGGYAAGPDGLGMPAVWTSTDGRNWVVSPAPPLRPTTAHSTQDMSITSLTAEGPQLFATGGNDPMPHLWTSMDSGANWNLLPDPVTSGPELFKDGVGLVDFAATADQAVALSEEPTVLVLGNSRWSDATGDEFPKGGDRPNATSVVLNDDGTLLAGGFIYNAPHDDKRENFSGRVWVGNGNSISVVKPSDDLPDLSAGHLTDIAAFKGGYVAVGVEDFSVANSRPDFFDRNPDGLLWTSADGTTWSRQAASKPRTREEYLKFAPENYSTDQIALAVAGLEESSTLVSAEPAGGTGTQTLQAVDRLGDGYIAVGRVFRDNDGDPNTEFDIDPVALASPDGVGIVDVAIPNFGGAGVQRLEDVCVDEKGNALAIGVNGTPQDLNVVVFLRTPDGVWTQGTAPDNTFAGPGGQRAASCEASKDGFLMVGTDDARGNVDARVWSSKDGLDWARLDAGSLGGSGNQTATAVAAVPGGGWLVGGNDSMSGDSDIALWRVLDNGEIRRRDRNEPSLGGPGDQRLMSLTVSGKHTVLVGNDRTGVGIWETSRLDR